MKNKRRWKSTRRKKNDFFSPRRMDGSIGGVLPFLIVMARHPP
ncbi:hypothetical protein CSUI_002873 [Cystoisospora suis]|uniref:Uncharacterized protein n=1 Tax=Cystoisospora suis TaxID=483139 RepID=A0A2C6L312_9APIC|nr:hypothetical protein CSUI_002873 [Cystoisospora suis]